MGEENLGTMVPCSDRLSREDIAIFQLLGILADGSQPPPHWALPSEEKSPIGGDSPSGDSPQANDWWGVGVLRTHQHDQLRSQLQTVLRIKLFPVSSCLPLLPTPVSLRAPIVEFLHVGLCLRVCF